MRNGVRPVVDINGDFDGQMFVVRGYGAATREFVIAQDGKTFDQVVVAVRVVVVVVPENQRVSEIVEPGKTLQDAVVIVENVFNGK